MKRLVFITTAATTAAAAAAATLWLAVPAGASLARPAVSGTENFQAMTTSATSNTYSTIATGVFTAGGVDHSGSGNVDTLVFPTGSFKLTHKGTLTQKLNPKTCLFTASEHATITLSGGTRAYKGISGSGTAQLSILAIAGKSAGKCAMTVKPVAWQLLIKGSASVSL
jgi:hypothetical protein